MAKAVLFPYLTAPFVYERCEGSPVPSNAVP